MTYASAVLRFAADKPGEIVASGVAGDGYAVSLLLMTHAAITEDAALPVKFGSDQLTGRNATPHYDDSGRDVFFDRTQRNLRQLQHRLLLKTAPGMAMD
jgi:hypothetical protein